jgi:hypothetical protein
MSSLKVHSLRGKISYAQYCARRGYKPPFKGLPVVKRSLVESWAQPGFHRFWRTWNPPIGYPLFRFYSSLGGNRHRIAATFCVFLANGLAHDMVVLAIAQRWSSIFIVAFTMFGFLNLLSLRLARVAKQERWPRLANIVMNATLVAGTLHVSIRFNRLWWGS